MVVAANDTYIGLSASKKIKLFDFGLAVAVKREGDDDGVYELTGGTGSRRYMAPEVCLRDNYGTKVDVYSWAIAARDGVWLHLYAIAATHRSIPIAGLGNLEPEGQAVHRL